VLSTLVHCLKTLGLGLGLGFVGEATSTSAFHTVPLPEEIGTGIRIGICWGGHQAQVLSTLFHGLKRFVGEAIKRKCFPHYSTA
jgi:hypothetical protein